MSIPQSSDSPPPSPTLSIDHFHELRPLIGQSMADQKDIDDVNLKIDSPGDAVSYRHAVLDDPAMEGLSLYEKKSLIVDRELDSHGMGKYQWYIFFLCGFGYLIDLLYAQAFGLVEPAIQQEFGFGGSYSTLCSELSFKGLTSLQTLSLEISSRLSRLD